MLKGDSVISNYKIITELKHGSQGYVYLVENMTTHEKSVLKSMFVEKSRKAEFEKLMEVWKRMSNSEEKDNIVKYKEHFDDGKNAIIIMEFCEGGDLESLIIKKRKENEKFSEVDVVKVLIEGMRVLKGMQAQNFIHRDIKSANLFFGKDGKLKFGDFNTSKVLEENIGASTVAGSLEYTAPEVLNSDLYSYPVDVFSFGAVLYQMMMGRTPFANERGIVMKNLTSGKYEPILTSLGYSQALIETVHSCLMTDPASRPTPTQVLASPFVLVAEADELRRQLAQMKEAKMKAEEKMVQLREAEKIGNKRIEELEARVREIKSQKWKLVGTLLNFDELVKKYPLTDYEWAGTYLTSNPIPLIIGYWNIGTRVYFRDCLIHGDDGAHMHRGNVLFTRGTSDAESKDEWYHRYVNANMEFCCFSNRYDGIRLKIFVREL